jgi:hypothetical protein
MFTFSWGHTKGTDRGVMGNPAAVAAAAAAAAGRVVTVDSPVVGAAVGVTGNNNC